MTAPAAAPVTAPPGLQTGLDATPDAAGQEPLATALSALAAAIASMQGGAVGPGGGSIDEIFPGADGMLHPQLGSSMRLIGQAQLDKCIHTRRTNPEATIQAHERIVQQRLQVLPGESWSWTRYYQVEVEPHAGNFLTLKRMGALIAAALDEGRTRSLLSQHAMLMTAMSVIESAAKDGSHELGWGWPLLGCRDPGGKPLPNWVAAETSALAAFHKEQAALIAAQKTLGGAGARGAADSSSSGGAQDPSGAALKSQIQGEIAANRARGAGPRPPRPKADAPKPGD